MKHIKRPRLDKSVEIQSLEKVMSERFKRFAKYNIQDRALPDVRDGLKPVQRRILFSMYELGLFHTKSFKKSARVVGEVIGKYHPHGDSSIYEALIRMAQEWKMNIPLVEVHGNKGSIDDDPAAAMRYTEARLSALAFESLVNLNKNTVKFAPNFDDSEQEPTVLPALVPNLLVNGAIGIASGYATEMPPHNLAEIIDGIIALISFPQILLEDMMKIVKGPDFPTGGIVQGLEGIKQAFINGQGRILIKSKIEVINQNPNLPLLKITQIPYGVVKIRLIKQISDIILDKKIVGIKDVRDESDREHGIQIVIELEKNVNVKTVLDYLLSKTDLQVYYHYNNVVIQNHEPKQLGLIPLMQAYLHHQQQVQTLALKFDLKKAQIRHEILIGLIKAKQQVNQIIDLIKNAEGSKQIVVQLLIQKLHYTPLQADAISELKLYRLSKTDQSGFESEKNLLSQKIEEYKILLNNKPAFNQYLIKLLLELKTKFPTPRKSLIQDEIERITINTDELIKHERAYLGVSLQGYLKRLSPRTFDANKLEEYGLKEQDSLIYLHPINTVDKILVFTNQGRFIFIPAHKVEESKWKDFGKHINDFATIDSQESIISILVINDFNLSSYVTLITKFGKGKRVLIKDFLVTRFSKSIQAIKLIHNDVLVSAFLTNETHDLILVSNHNKAWRYPAKDLPIYGLNSNGVKVANLGKNHANTLVTATFGHSNTTLGFISTRGGLKLMKLSNFILTNRSTKGKDWFKQIKSSPHFLLTMNPATNKTSIFTLMKDGIKIVNLKKLEITSSDTSFSLGINKPIIHASIMSYQRLDLEAFESSQQETSLDEEDNLNNDRQTTVVKEGTNLNSSNQIIDPSFNNNESNASSDKSHDLPSLDEILDFKKSD